MISAAISSNPTTTDFGAKWYTDVLYQGVNSGTLIFVKPIQGNTRDYFTRVATFDLSDPAGLAGAIQFAASPQGADCYHKYNLFDGNAVAARGNAAIGGKNEVAGVVAFGLDLDVDWKDSKYLNQQQLIDICNNMPVPPSVVVGSDGVTGGLHVYWAIQAVDARGFPGGYHNLNGIACRWYRELARRIAAQGGVIDATAGLERLVRFPGMLRSKSGQRVTVLSGTGHRHTLSELILEPDEVDAAEAKVVGAIRDTGTSVIAKGLDELGLELPDMLGWLGWSERPDGSGMVDRPEGTSGSCTGIYASSKDGRLGITIRTPGSIKTLMTDPITGQPFETAFPKITWLSRESFYVMATEGSIDQDAWKRVAKKFACMADNFQPIPVLPDAPEKRGDIKKFRSLVANHPNPGRLAAYCGLTPRQLKDWIAAEQQSPGSSVDLSESADWVEKCAKHQHRRGVLTIATDAVYTDARFLAALFL